MVPVLYYDGTCGLCSRAVRFILRHERNHVLAFAALQSAQGKKILAANNMNIEGPYDTMLYDDGERVWQRSRGALQVAIMHLGGPFPLLARIARILPRWLTDLAYDFVAKNRFHLFGKSDLCELPSPEQAKRFVGDTA